MQTPSSRVLHDYKHTRKRDFNDVGFFSWASVMGLRLIPVRFILGPWGPCFPEGPDTQLL